MNRHAAAMILFLLFPMLIFAQGEQKLSTQNKKAEKLFYLAIDDYDGQRFDMALATLDKALVADPRFIEAWILKGDILAEKNKPEEAAAAYKAALDVDPAYSSRLYLILGNLQLLTGNYADARKNLSYYLTLPGIQEKSKAQASESLDACDFALRAITHPVPFNPVNLGDSVNTQYSEYVNAITTDNSRLYFTRNIPRDAMYSEEGPASHEEFFYCDRVNDSLWRKALNLGPPINTAGNEGGLFISPDGRFLFFAACERDDGLGSCDLYWSRRKGTGWTVPENIGPPVNSPSWDSQPSFSSDGRTLYFASKRPGGKGSSDIWKCELREDGTWTKPVNLGDSVNTAKEEMAPFIHPDDQTLYFSSRGHRGMGGFDLFYAKRDPKGAWKRPVNMGYPINTSADEITLVVDPEGAMAYISSGKFGGKGRQDIYSFKLYKEAQPERVTYFKGIVFDKETKRKLEADFELTDIRNGQVMGKSKSDPVTGEFLLALPISHDYALNVSREGYLFYSDNFSLADPGKELKPFIKSVPLQPLKAGETVVLKNIFFDTDKYDLKPESEVELQKLTALLKKNPSMKIEISGHTDNEGTPEYNVGLSQNRAKAVYNYLIEKGIAKERLSYQGYGLTRPIDTNDTPEGRANNRRTEFRVISN